MSCSKPLPVSEHSLQAKIKEDFLKCPICHDTFEKPRNLDCGHIFCEKCLDGVAQSRKKTSKPLLCPVCREKTYLPRKGVSGLPENFVVSGLTSLLQKPGNTVTNEESDRKDDEASGTPKTNTSTGTPKTNTSLVKKMVKAYENVTGKKNTSLKKTKKPERKESLDSVSSTDEDSSSDEDSDLSDSTSDGSESETGETINSFSSSGSNLLSENNDLSQLSFVELNSSSSGDSEFSVSSDATTDSSSSEECTSEESDESSESESDSQSSSTDTDEDSTERMQDKFLNDKKGSSTTNLTTKENKPPSTATASKRDRTIIKSCNGMKIGTEIALFVQKNADPLIVKLIWLEKVKTGSGSLLKTFAGVELKSKKFHKKSLSKEFLQIKKNTSAYKSWLTDDKIALRAVVPITQCIPKNLLKAISSNVNMK